jgi:hypothetical protein
MKKKKLLLMISAGIVSASVALSPLILNNKVEKQIKEVTKSNDMYEINYSPSTGHFTSHLPFTVTIKDTKEISELIYEELYASNLLKLSKEQYFKLEQEYKLFESVLKGLEFTGEFSYSTFSLTSIQYDVHVSKFSDKVMDSLKSPDTKAINKLVKQVLDTKLLSFYGVMNSKSDMSLALKDFNESFILDDITLAITSKGINYKIHDDSVFFGTDAFGIKVDTNDSSQIEYSFKKSEFQSSKKQDVIAQSYSIRDIKILIKQPKLKTSFDVSVGEYNGDNTVNSDANEIDALNASYTAALNNIAVVTETHRGEVDLIKVSGTIEDLSQSGLIEYLDGANNEDNALVVSGFTKMVNNGVKVNTNLKINNLKSSMGVNTKRVDVNLDLNLPKMAVTVKQFQTDPKFLEDLKKSVLVDLILNIDKASQEALLLQLPPQIVQMATAPLDAGNYKHTMNVKNGVLSLNNKPITKL